MTGNHAFKDNNADAVNGDSASEPTYYSMVSKASHRSSDGNARHMSSHATVQSWPGLTKAFMALIGATVMAASLMGTMKIMPAMAAGDKTDHHVPIVSNEDGTVAASRSFTREPLKSNLLKESTSVGNETGGWDMSDSNLGYNLIKNADEQTKKIEAKRKAEEEQKRKDEEALKAQEQVPSSSSSNADASNSWTRSDLPDVPSSTVGRKITDEAAKLVGQHMDCTMLVSKAIYAATGIWFHGWPEDYANMPGVTEVNWKDAQPGDILIYPDGSSFDMNGRGHADHVAIYAGNGMAVHGGWNGYTVAIATADVSYQAPRVFRLQR